MGCVFSKKAAPVTLAVESADVSASLDWSRGTLNSALWNQIEVDRIESGESANVSSNGVNSQSFRLGSFYKNVEGEQVAAGWPSWLSAVAREAIQGWVPLRAESFEKLEKGKDKEANKSMYIMLLFPEEHDCFYERPATRAAI